MTLLIGIDGGGTKTRARLVDGSGLVLGSGVAGPSNTRIGIEGSLAAIEAAARAALADAALADIGLADIHAGIGLAGYHRTGVAEALARYATPFASVRYDGDVAIANLGAHGGGDGASLIVGTGSIAMMVRAGVVTRFGGYGFPISDEGSGAWLGLDAVRHALQVLDGRLVPGELGGAVLERLGPQSADVVAWADRASPTDYATLAPLVTAAAETGDPVAIRIMLNAADSVSAFVRALDAKGAGRICLMGGLGPILARWLPAIVAERLSKPLGDAIDGAILLATESSPTPR